VCPSCGKGELTPVNDIISESEATCSLRRERDVLSRQEEAYAHMFPSDIWDIGTPESYEELQKRFAR
jgi:hypothetical protein